MRSCVGSHKSTAERLGVQVFVGKVSVVPCRDFQFGTRGRAQVACAIDYRTVAKIEFRYGQINLRALRSLHNRQWLTRIVQYHNPVTFGTVNRIGELCRTMFAGADRVQPVTEQ